MRVLAVAVALAAGCGGPELHIEARSAHPAVRGQEAAIRATAEDAARWWGGDSSDLEGWTMVLVDEPLDGTCERSACARLSDRHVFIDCRILGPGDVGAVTLRALIRHEAGHVVLWSRAWNGDGEHRDPRWSGL